MDLASHHIDLVRLIFGQEISEVSAEMRSERSEDDNAVLQIRMKNDLLIQSFFSLNSVEEDKIEIYGQMCLFMLKVIYAPRDVYI